MPALSVLKMNQFVERYHLFPPLFGALSFPALLTQVSTLAIGPIIMLFFAVRALRTSRLDQWRGNGVFFIIGQIIPFFGC